MAATRKLPADDAVLKMYKSGVTSAQIAEIFGVNAPAVIAAVRRAEGRPYASETKRKEQNRALFHRASDTTNRKERNPIYIDREECRRCGSRDRKLCGH